MIQSRQSFIKINKQLLGHFLQRHSNDEFKNKFFLALSWKKIKSGTK